MVSSLAVYVAGLVLLAWEGRRDLAILLAAVGGVALSIATALPVGIVRPWTSSSSTIRSTTPIS